MENLNRELGVVHTKLINLETEVSEVFDKIDHLDNRLRKLEDSIHDLTRVVEDQKKTIAEVADIIKSLQLLKKIGYIAAWITGAVLAWKTSGLREFTEWIKK